MGILEKITKGMGVGSKDTNFDEALDEVGIDNVDVLHEAADFYVVPVPLENDNSVHEVMEQLKSKNIVLLNVTPMSKQPNKLKQMIDNIKSHVIKINGDIARIDAEKILLTPTKVKIVKSRKK